MLVKAPAFSSFHHGAPNEAQAASASAGAADAPLTEATEQPRPPPAAPSCPGCLVGVRRRLKGGQLGGGCCSGVNKEVHFVPRLCEEVTAQEERPRAAAAGRLEIDLFLLQQEVAG